MRKFVAMTCVWSIVMMSPAALAADASPRAPQDRRVEELGVRWTEATPLDEEITRFGEAMRRAQADEVRSLAVIEVLQPTASPFVWDLLGSDDGVDWKELGIFYLLEGETPQPRPVIVSRCGSASATSS